MKKYLAYLFILFSGSSHALTPVQQEALTTHNKLRSKHSAPAMRWDNTLARYAEQYAARCHFRHSHGGYGENLAAGFPSAKAAIQAWYDEHESYDYKRGRFSRTTGHFTQLVWKASIKLGCAVAECNGRNGTKGKYLVCEYGPAGNMLGTKYFRENVTAV
jgi:hypothetical protein